MLPFMRIVRLEILVAMNTVLEGEIQYNLVEKYHLEDTCCLHLEPTTVLIR